MSAAALVGVIVLVVGAVVLAVAGAGLARANPVGGAAGRGGGNRVMEVPSIAGVGIATIGVIMVKDEVGWWAVAPAFVLAVGPLLVVLAVHRRTVARRRRAGGQR